MMTTGARARGSFWLDDAPSDGPLRCPMARRLAFQPHYTPLELCSADVLRALSSSDPKGRGNLVPGPGTDGSPVW